MPTGPCLDSRIPINDHAAVRAWERLGAVGAAPQRLTVLKPENKRSAVYRMESGERSARPIIAKRGRAERLMVELLIYQEVLANLPLRTLQCFGSIADEDPDFAWLFLEDAGETRFSPVDAEHRAFAARWFCALHQCVEPRAYVKALLPGRESGHYRSILSLSQNVIRAAMDNPALTPDDRTLLRPMLNHCAALWRHWSEIEEICQYLPHTLVHGDFFPKNARVCQGPEGPRLYPLDWDDAGWGTPAADLSQTDTTIYWSAARWSWPALRLELVERLATIGRIFWALDPITGELETLAGDWPGNAMRKLRAYAWEIGSSLQSLGWS